MGKKNIAATQLLPYLVYVVNCMILVEGWELIYLVIKLLFLYLPFDLFMNDSVNLPSRKT